MNESVQFKLNELIMVVKWDGEQKMLGQLARVITPTYVDYDRYVVEIEWLDYSAVARLRGISNYKYNRIYLNDRFALCECLDNLSKTDQHEVLSLLSI